MPSKISNEYSLDNMIKIALDLSAEKDFNRLMEKILSEAMGITHCDAGTVYIKEKDFLEFYTVCTKSKGILMGRNDKNAKMPPVPLSRKHVCACSAMDNKKINIADVYNSTDYDFAGAQKYDALNDYRTTSMLVIPMADEKDNVIGVLQLINSLDENGEVMPFDKKYEDVVSALASLAAVSINNHKLAQEITNLLHSFVAVMVDAIEARTPYNANHTRSMVRYADRFITYLADTENEWKFDSDRKDAYLMSVWLHDIGKLVVPLEVLDKPDRLGPLRDRIKSKIEVTRLNTELLKAKDGGDRSGYDEKIERLQRSWELIDRSNNAPFLDDETINELKACADTNCVTVYGEEEKLLNDRELEAITVQRGTLTAKERSKVEEHVSYTARMLEKMSFTGIYEKVPFWAGSHHEFINGTGYPNHLSGEDLPMETRLLTIIDIYDALTAEDRPYKPPMPAEKAFAILEDMAKEGKIDKDILTLFRKSKAWGKDESK
ncbi:MAG: GAF domain-containing protein [Lachnospiraceae bacterium]|nr:GAF domain-containing protein [Lachnospiraceae bacterium]